MLSVDGVGCQQEKIAWIRLVRARRLQQEGELDHPSWITMKQHQQYD